MDQVMAALVGAIIAALMGLLLFAAYEGGQRSVYTELRDQCERQGSIRLGKEAMLYCAREPVKPSR